MNKLFCDLKTDEEKAEFFLSGRGYETGVIAHSIQNDVAMAYHRCAEYKKELATLQAECDKPKQAVDEAMMERIAALLYEEAIDEPWTVAGIEHPGPDRGYYRGLARKVLALASAPPSAPSDDLPTLLDNLMRAAYDDGDRGREKLSGATMTACEAVLAHVRAQQSAAVEETLRGALEEAEEAMRFVHTSCATFPQEPQHVQNAAWRRVVNAITKAHTVLGRGGLSDG